MEYRSTQRWALILGASSGFGAATGLALAKHGYDIFGVHLDRRSTLPNVEKIISDIRAMGRRSVFFNINAASPERRAEVIQTCRETIGNTEGSGGIHLLLHSIAFGTLKPYLGNKPGSVINAADMTMTLDVMAHSLVYWVQDLLTAKLLLKGAKILAMTSAGAHRVWPTYGAVSAAKAALESHVRQLAVELAPLGISVNALRAGVADTPAARKIPGSELMFAHALELNPARRLTIPEDVAEIVVSFCSCESSWMTGNIIGVDGGEDLIG